MIYAVILAGGRGTRFWPLSSQLEPKQFLNLCSNKPMIEETIHRIAPLIGNSNIYIATNKIYHKHVKDYLKKLGISKDNIFFEPQRKNTLAPIGVLAKEIYDKDKKAVILVLPSDHYIKEKGKFLKTLGRAISVAKEGYIVTIGIRPNRPETGYGYIKVESSEFKVDKFIEKPNRNKAEAFLKDKRYYWNAGIFIFRADLMLGEIRKFAPDTYQIIMKINDQKSLNKFWPKLASISIDYAVMEKTRKIALIPADFSWSDLGSWQAVEYLSKKDKSGNIFKGKCVDIGSKNIISWADNRLVATLGLDNLIIVDTKHALLVCAKDRAQEVKLLVRKLKQKA